MRRLWNHPDISMVGRKTLLERQIKPRVDNPNLRFILTGEKEVGKTALLEAAYDLCQGKKSLIHAGKAHSEICRQIIRDWGIEVDSEKPKPTVLEMESAIFSSTGNHLFIDDIHRSSAVKKTDFFRTVADRHKVCGSVLKGAGKENLKPLMAKMGKEIKVPRLSRPDCLKLAERVCIHLGSRLSHIDIANACAGLPGKIVSMAHSNEIQRNEIRPQSDEIDIAPVFLMLAAGLMIFRYIGRVTDATDFVLLGGIGMVALLFARGIFQKGREK